MGRMLDMQALAGRNEKVRAVGNGKMNARGDIIDPSGRVVVPVTQKISETYARTVSNPGAQIQSDTLRPVAAQALPEVVEDLSSFEQELDKELANDLEVEQIKIKETRKGKQ
jgi:hypothetical protein